MIVELQRVWHGVNAEAECDVFEERQPNYVMFSDSYLMSMNDCLRAIRTSGTVSTVGGCWEEQYQ
ncbi:hypothetical protein M758_1G091300 [Ceratodon purpureus]|nr:hypothetical protein M758_1G091300 [Ceratodon purpureus]